MPNISFYEPLSEILAFESSFEFNCNSPVNLAASIFDSIFFELSFKLPYSDSVCMFLSIVGVAAWYFFLFRFDKVPPRSFITIDLLMFKQSGLVFSYIIPVGFELKFEIMFLENSPLVLCLNLSSNSFLVGECLDVGGPLLIGFIIYDTYVHYVYNGGRTDFLSYGPRSRLRLFGLSLFSNVWSCLIELIIILYFLIFNIFELNN